MAILLLGNWDHGGNLVITKSHSFEDDDQEGINSAVADQGDEDQMAWACSFLVDSHKEAIQEAYETYVAHEGTRLFDNVEDFEPDA